MEIEEAFTQEAIAAADTDVTGEAEVEVRQIIRRVCQLNEVEMQRDQENVALLAFVAGLTLGKSDSEKDEDGVYFTDPNHALRAGMALGVLLKHGLDAEPGIDEAGNYTDVITFDYPWQEGVMSFRVKVMP